MRMQFIKFVFVVLTFYFQGIKCDCNKYTGPVGSNECQLIRPNYTQNQWVYCKTDTYIQLKSKGYDRCTDRSATYCYYQCNTDVNDDGGLGEVLPNCQCNPGDVISTPISLPGSCTSPDGSDCNWYTDCLQKRYPCKSAGEISYATDFALNFCKLYTDHHQRFSDTGNRWVDAVRKCLQVQLACHVNPNIKVTCQKIQDTAIATHYGCYTYPGNEAPSICKVQFADWAKAFWTIKGSFFVKATLIPMLASMAKLPLTCTWQEHVTSLVPILFINLRVRLDKRLVGKRLLDESSLNEYDIVIQVTELLSRQMQWHEKGVAWFTYFDENSVKAYNTTHSSVPIYLMLAPKADYDLNADSTTVSVNITEIVIDFEYAMKNGDISNPSDNVWNINSIQICNDILCRSSSHYLGLNVTSDNSESETETDNTGLYNALKVLGVIVGVAIIIFSAKYCSNEDSARVTECVVGCWQIDTD